MSVGRVTGLVISLVWGITLRLGIMGDCCYYGHFLRGGLFTAFGMDRDRDRYDMKRRAELSPSGSFPFRRIYSREEVAGSREKGKSESSRFPVRCKALAELEVVMVFSSGAQRKPGAIFGLSDRSPIPARPALLSSKTTPGTSFGNAKKNFPGRRADEVSPGRSSSVPEGADEFARFLHLLFFRQSVDKKLHIDNSKCALTRRLNRTTTPNRSLAIDPTPRKHSLPRQSSCPTVDRSEDPHEPNSSATNSTKSAASAECKPANLTHTILRTIRVR